MTALIANQLVRLPQGVTFDGVWDFIAAAAFTDRDPASPSCGASFDLPLAGLSSEGIAAKLAAKQREFSQRTEDAR